MSFIVKAIVSLFRTIFYGIDEMLYGLIPDLYTVFYDLCLGKLLSNEIVENITNNIYILVSVVMLFAFGVQLIKAIINPDLLTDSKKGTSAYIKRLVISVALISLIPIFFSTIYKFQQNILENAFIEKLVMGMGDVKGQKKNATAKDIAQKTGEYLAGTSFACVFYPNKGATSENSTTSFYYNAMKNQSINYMNYIDYNETFENSDGDDEFVFRFEKLVSVGVGIFILYVMVLNCFDMALRLAKLAFYEISAPIAIMQYLFNGADAIKKWFTEVLSTFAGVFIKILTLSFIVVGLRQIQVYMDDNKINNDNWLFRLFMICGLLMLCKQLPQLIQSLFGINIDSGKGGIKGRLAGMAGVGAAAANAVKHPIKNFVSKPAGAVSGAVGTAVGAGQRGRQIAADIRKNGGKGAAVRGALAGVGSALINTPTGIRQGFKEGKIRQFGEQKQYYKDTHPNDYTLRGRVGSFARDMVGMQTKAESMDKAINKANPINFVDRNGVAQSMSEGQAANYKRNLQTELAGYNQEQEGYNNIVNDQNRILERNNAVASAMQGASERARSIAERSDSSYVPTKNNAVNFKNGQKLDMSGKNLDQWKNTLEALRSSVPKEPDYPPLPERSSYSNDADYQTAVNAYNSQIQNMKNQYNQAISDHAEMINDFQNAYNQATKEVSDQVMSDYLSGAVTSSTPGFDSQLSDAIQSVRDTMNSAGLGTIDTSLDYSAFSNNISNQIHAANSAANQSILDARVEVDRIQDNINAVNTELSHMGAAEEQRSRNIDAAKQSREYKQAQATSKNRDVRHGNNKK